MSGSESEDFFVEITFKKTGLTCGSGYCSKGIKVRREAISGKLVSKKKKSLKKQFLEMRARKAK